MININDSVLLSEYDQRMILQFQDTIHDGVLDIYDNQQVSNLDFIQNLNVHKLTLYGCRYIENNITNNMIKELYIDSGCHFTNVLGLKLNNLEVLIIEENRPREETQQILIKMQNSPQFSQLRELDLFKDEACWNKRDQKMSEKIEQLTNQKSLTNLVKLKLIGNYITDIEVLSTLVNLEELDLSKNKKINISPIKYLTKLTKLSLEKCELKDIQGLSFLTNLIYLNLNGNIGLNIFPVQHLRQLNHLKLQETKIIDISILNLLINMKDLDISHNNINCFPLVKNSYQKLQNLHQMVERQNISIQFLSSTELNLSNKNISNISSIAKLKNLKKIYLNYNSIEDISTLQSLPDLTHLSLFYNKLTSYTLALPNLLELSLSYNKLEDKSGLQHSPKLENLDLNKTETTDLLTIPPQLFGLKELELSSNNLTEISYLSNFVDLQILYLSYNLQLKNIEPLKFCTQLTELSICETGVSDIWPLQFLINLKTLEIANTKVVDLHPLQYLYKLEDISAYHTCIIDVSPLAKLTLLESLNFSFNKITNAETLKHHKNFSEYDFSHQEVPKPDELTFYSKILSVHSSHKQIRKIQAENRVSKFRESMTRQKEDIKLKINEQIRVMNQNIEIWAQFIQNSNADQ
ncbi:Conserved_hypothetical protein [Hexamita inflata]|uniref:Uncharacterized protein n=1 Tax=Hexamita inflata TaxID=28002 RepID=A0AA86REM8_9EUKA|nr:Conserved hypothetical protein [Hexamita inflata]